MKTLAKHTTEIEITLLLEALYQKYGYDFRQYSKAHITRRVMNTMMMNGIDTVTEIQSKLLHDRKFASQLLLDLSSFS